MFLWVAASFKSCLLFVGIEKSILEKKKIHFTNFFVVVVVMKMQSPKMEEEEVERRRKKWPWMKAAQLVEFQMQALVYRYIEAGLRVPHHLVVPIWKSVALSSSSSSIYNHHSSSRKYF